MRAYAAGVLVALLAAGCSTADNAPDAATGDESAPTVAGRTLRPVTVPDLSQMVVPVQGQIREAHEAVTSRLQASPPALHSLSAAYGTLGRLLLAAGYPDSAEPCFFNARALDASDYRWPYYLAHIHRERGQLDQAQGYYEDVLALRPDDVDALVWMGEVWLALGRADEAESKFSRAMAIAPTSLSARYGLGRTALARQDYRGAVDHLSRVLKQDPDAAAAHYPLALGYQGLGDETNAALHLRQREDHRILPADPLIVELDGLLESPQAYETRGIRALDREEWTESAGLFRKGLAIDPESAALRHRLGTALFMQGDLAGARTEFEHAVRVAPDYFPAQFSLGVLLQDEGRHREAIARFEEALQHRPTYLEARLRLAANLRRVGRPVDALAQFEQVLGLDAGIVEAHLGRAMTLVETGRFAAARDRLREARRAYPGEPVFAHALARVLAAAPDPGVRNGQEAVAIVTSLLESEQRTVELGETYAMALAASGAFAEAASLQSELIRGAEGVGFVQALPRLKTNLALYQRGRPAETPWAEGEVP